jgi:hypothetical protein
VRAFRRSVWRSAAAVHCARPRLPIHTDGDEGKPQLERKPSLSWDLGG